MMKIIWDSLKVILPVGLAVLLVFLAFRNIDLEEFWSNLSKVNYSWIIFSMLLSIVAYVVRAYRWRILLKPLGYHPSLYNTSISVIVGYLANLALPRLGEVMRCSFLLRTNNVPINRSLGTVISERIVDLLMLIIFIFIALLLEFDMLFDLLGSSLESLDLELSFGWVSLFLAFLLVGFFVVWRFISRGFFPKIKVFLKGIIDGALSIRHINNLGGFLLSSLLIWLIYYFMSYTIIFSLPASQHLGLTAGLLLLVTGGIAISLPVQAGFGTYHTMISALLLLYGIDQTSGLFLATLLHTSQVLAVVLIGGISLFLALFIKPKNEADKIESHHSGRDTSINREMA